MDQLLSIVELVKRRAHPLLLLEGLDVVEVADVLDRSALPVGTDVTYVIIAQDNSGSTISSKDQGYSFDYPVVIPEF